MECRVSESPGVFDFLVMLVMMVWLVCQSVVCFLLVVFGQFKGVLSGVTLLLMSICHLERGSYVLAFHTDHESRG